MNAMVTFLSTSPDFTGSLYGFQKASELSTAEAIDSLTKAAAEGLVETNVEDRNGKSVLTATLSRRAVRKFNKARRAENAEANIATVLSALDEKRPQRVGDLVKATGMERQDVIDACRAAKENGTLFSFNSTNSNFHCFYSPDASNAIFPEPAPEPEVEASADDAAPEATDETEEATSEE